jgi:tyrosine-protein kinase Etk/Wzc
LLQLQGNVQVLNTAYTNLLNESQQLEVAQAGTLGDVRIVDPAAVDITTPVKPKKLILVLGATFFGAFLALGYIFSRRMLNRSLEDPLEIEQMGLPVYASIPLSEEERTISRRRFSRRAGYEPRRLLALAAPSDVATEAMRVLRTSLTFAKREAGNNLLMVSGTSPNAGKTFVSANLATLMSQSGKRVLLIDANLRDGSLHKLMGSHANNGLSDLIAGQIGLAIAIRQVHGLRNLHFIPRGGLSAQPSELLMDPRFTTLLQRLSADYDFIVLDSPPILAVTDAAVIGRHAGTNILVVRFGVNESKEIELAKQRFAHSGVDIHGVVFNAVERRNGNHWQYDYYGDVAAG